MVLHEVGILCTLIGELFISKYSHSCERENNRVNFSFFGGGEVKKRFNKEIKSRLEQLNLISYFENNNAFT